MSPRASKSVTLLELLISIVLIGLVVLGLSNIELFCRNQLLSSDRRLKVQNDASFVLEHMTKHIGRAIGDTQNYPVDFGANCVRAIIDSNNNGLLDLAEVQSRIAYRWDPAAYTVSYCGSFNVGTQSCQPAGGWEILARHITTTMLPPNVDTHGDQTNYISVNITACWDPANPPCNTINNPEVNMRSRIIMPSVSIR
jgi:Tfp pilus assembly protein PilW